MQFRLRAYRSAAASTALRMQWPFSKGMTFDELVHAFKSSQILPKVATGEDLHLDESAILMSGSVDAFVPAVKRPDLKRKGNLSRIARVSTNPVIAPAVARESARASAGSYQTIEAPAMLQPGTYPAKSDCSVRFQCF